MLLLFRLFQPSGLYQDPTHNREAVCFVYHRVGDARYPSTNISTDDFEAHLRFLKDNEYKVLSLSEAVEYLRLPGEYEKVAVLTIDDGYESFFKNGVPLLKKYGFPATLAINTETVGGRSYMSWEQLKACQEAGIEIANHSHSHPYFLNLDKEERYVQLRSEIEQSQQIIQNKLGIKPDLFIYPYGEFDLDMKRVVKELGFKAAAAQNSGVMHTGSDFYALCRFPMASVYAAPDKFIAKAKMKALKVDKVVPESFLVPAGSNRPALEVVFQENDLLLSSIQCFIQGAECKMETEEKDGKVSVTVLPSSALKARRTLYTITIRDEDGVWHWFSHLWIDPGKE